MSGLVCLAVAAALGGSPHLVRPDDGIGCVDLVMSPTQVRAGLGPPTRVRRGPWRIGFIARTWIYERRGLTVQFVFGGVRLYVYEITTRNPRDRTRRGIGVGAGEANVRRHVSDVYCSTDPHVGRYCKRPREGGVGGTFFLIRRGRVARVSVFAPAF